MMLVTLIVNRPVAGFSGPGLIRGTLHHMQLLVAHNHQRAYHKHPALMCCGGNNKTDNPLFIFQGRIKKIMQTDEEVGKVAAAVPIMIYILFIQSTL